MLQPVMMCFSNLFRLIEMAEPESILNKLSLLMESKKDAFQLVLLSRLTPIPFGLQNSLFAVSTMSFEKYLQATCLGLFPCQVINVYLGSTLRSMEEVRKHFTVKFLSEPRILSTLSYFNSLS